MAEPNTKDTKSVTCGYYAVALVDLLGQGSELQHLTDLPESPEQIQVFHKTLRRTAGQVYKLRKAFTEFFGAFCDEQQPPSYRLPSEELKAAHERLTKAEIGCQHFSDTTILFSRIAVGGGEVTMNGVFGMLCGCGSAMLALLARKAAPRGAIEIGIGGDFFPDTVYGPVLDRAYYLERTVAQYPRIVVGPGAMEYIEVGRKGSFSPDPGGFHQGVAERCNGLIAVDQDGMPFVDFLGNGFRQLENASRLQAAVNVGFDFVSSEHRRFVTERNHKLALRYAWLKQYYESRLPLWK